MGEKDISEKSLEECNDVFADIVNVLLFNGEQVVSPDELSEATPYSNYSANGKIRNQERDVFKYWNNTQIRVAALGLENQTTDDDDMPLRIINYDASAYRAQLKQGNKNKRYPVVSLVLYFGYKEKWNKAKTLYDRLEIADRLKKYVSDYRINLFEIAYLEDDQVAKFKSDFRFVADYFVQMRKTGKYIPPDEKVTHVQELLTLMRALTGNQKFVEAYDEQKGKERISMRTFLDDAFDEGEAKGEAKGITKGITTGKITARYEDGMPIEKIAERTNVSVDIVVSVLKEANLIKD
jgi:hypothetical protein